MPLAFLRDRQGNSPAREEWRQLFNTVGWPNLARILAYLHDVDSFGRMAGNPALSQALHIKDNLYWFSVGDLGVLFSYDGTDLVIIELTRFEDENEGKKKALEVAERRI